MIKRPLKLEPKRAAVGAPQISWWLSGEAKKDAFHFVKGVALARRAVVSGPLACIAADWGTTNRRAWALGQGGEIIDRRKDDGGLLAVQNGGFAESFLAFCGDWLQRGESGRGVPVIMGGMVGSKLGWKEAPYLRAPVALSRLAENLCSLGDVAGASVWIVPGVARDDAVQPEVMRGEECEILGALQATGVGDGVFLLPGTHTKWAIVEAGRLSDFRTYMTGEIFGLLRKSGTLSQVMTGDAVDPAAFLQGVARAGRPETANLLHSLFSVRTLGLFDRLPPTALPGYMSGLLIGAELRDAAAWLTATGKAQTGALRVIGIGAPALLKAYGNAAAACQVELTALDSGDLLPRALFSIAQAAGLLRNG